MAKASGLKYQFLEVSHSNEGSPEPSCIESYAENGDWAPNIRLRNSNRYEVETISLDDLLDQYNAPGEIQFLSPDTEGSELEILRAYSFGCRRIHSIYLQHNYARKVD